MRSEQELRTAIAQIIEEYERKNRNGKFPQTWLSMTYFNLGVLYSIGDLKEIPDILQPVIEIKNKEGKEQ